MRSTTANRSTDPPNDASTPSPDAIAANPRYRRLIRRILKRKGVLAQDRDDVHQEVIAAVLAYLPSAAPVRSMEALIARISLRQAADNVLARGRLPVAEYDDDTGAGPPSSQRPIPPPDTACALKQERETLDAIVEQMEAEQHHVFLLVELEEKTLKEAADELRLLVTTAQARLRKGRRRFRELRDGAKR